MIRSEESSLPNFVILKVKAGACCLVSRHSVSVTPKTWGGRDTLKCELGQKESTNSGCRSVLRVSGVPTNKGNVRTRTESQVCLKRVWRSVSQRCLPRETESMCKNIFHPKQC